MAQPLWEGEPMSTAAAADARPAHPHPRRTQSTPSPRRHHGSPTRLARRIPTHYQAVIIRPGTKVNRVLRLILTLLTLGLWVIVWVILAITRKREQRAVLDVDQFGNVIRAVAWA